MPNRPESTLTAEIAPVSKDGLKTSLLRDAIQRDASNLAGHLRQHQLNSFPPNSRKIMRRFPSAETAKLLGIAEGYLRQIIAEERVVLPDNVVLTGGRRMFSVEDIVLLRDFLTSQARSRVYSPIRRAGEHTQIIGIMNFKGGSGKTTTTAHLAQYLCLRGYRVLALDLDPQASLTSLMGIQPEIEVGENETLYGVIGGNEIHSARKVIRKTFLPNLDIVPANLELMEFEHYAPQVLMQGSGSPLFARVSQALAPVLDDYDVVVVDCPPQLGFLTLSALTAATSLLITVHPQMLDVLSMSQFLRMVSDLLQVVGQQQDKIFGQPQNDYDWLSYLMTRYEPSDGPQTQMQGFMRAIFGGRVLTHPMLKSTAVSDAGLTSQTLYEVERQQFSRGTYDRAIDSMDMVNREIEEKILTTWGRPITTETKKTKGGRHVS